MRKEATPRRDVGTMGELRLQQWCAEISVPCNKALQDLGGWDYLLELEPRAVTEPNVPLDLRPSGRSCLVQVKSTDRRSGRASIKLSNWRRLATSPLPSFFLVLEFDGRSHPARAYLVHVWRTQISKVLKRLRRLSADEPRVDIRSRKVVLKWSDAERLPSPTALALLEALTAAIGPDPVQYGAEKRELLDQLGYEGDTGHFKVTVRIPKDRETSWHDLFTDLQLGLVEELETTGGAFWDRRFGIQITEPQKVFNTVGKLVARKDAPLRGPLEFRSGTRRVRVEADILVASLTGATPKAFDHLKIRIRLPFLDLVTAPRDPGCQISWRWPPSDAITPLSELVSLARVLDFLSHSAQGGECEVWLLEKHLAAMSVPEVALPAEHAEMVQSVLGAWEVAKAADLQDRGRVSLEGLWLQREAVRTGRAVLRQTARDASIIFDLNDSDSLEPQRWAVPALVAVWFDTELVVVPVLHEGLGSTAPDGSQYVVAIDRSVIGEPFVLQGTEDIDEASLYQDAAALASASGTEVLRWWERGGTAEPA